MATSTSTSTSMQNNTLPTLFEKVTGSICLCLFLFIAAGTPAVAGKPALPITVKGIVYNDANGNGIRDNIEEALVGIPVSNGDTIVLTKPDGSYALTISEGMSVFPILPAGKAMSGGRLANAAFFYADYTQQARKQCRTVTADFALKPRETHDDFTLNAVGDIQVGDYQELEYLSRTLLPELMHGQASDTNIFLGDLVNNNLSLYADLRDMMQALPQQSWTLPGNHDRDVDSVITRQNRTYGKFFGADCFAFNEGRAHFVILNNVYGKGSRGYEGRISDRQLRFVANDLRMVSKDRLVIVCAHVPLAFTKNKDSLLSLLRGYDKALVLSGHLHRVARFFHRSGGNVIPELGAGAACGFWWVGEKDWEGVPSALQQCGTPRNYFQVSIHGDSYDFRCKAIGQDGCREMSIRVTGIDTLDNHLRDYRDVPRGLMLATVYGGCDSTTVECRIDGGAWQPCSMSEYVERNVAWTREMNLIDAYPTKYNRMNPMRHRPSGQLWQLRLPAEALTGAHSLEVRAYDRYGLRATGIRMYCMPR